MDIDAEVAEKVIGYTFAERIAPISRIREVQAVRPGELPMDGSAPVGYTRWSGAWQIGSVPAYSTDIAAAREVEAKIDTLAIYMGKVVPHVVKMRVGVTMQGAPLRERYVLALMREVGVPECEVTTMGHNNWVGHRFRMDELWALIYATPEQRCRAALAACEEPQHGH